MAIFLEGQIFFYNFAPPPPKKKFKILKINVTMSSLWPRPVCDNTCYIEKYLCISIMYTKNGMIIKDLFVSS